MKRPISDLNNQINELKIMFKKTPNLTDEEIFSSNIIHWQPLYDLYVLGNEVVVTLEMAGIDIKDFSIYANPRFMVVDGVRKSPNILTQECCTFHNIEIPYGRFYRRITFPIPVEPKDYRYKMDNGLLTIRFPVIKEKVIPIE